MQDAIERDGFAIIPDALAGTDIDGLVAAVERIPLDEPRRSQGGVRDLFTHLPEVRQLAAERLREFVVPILGEGCFAVRAILFDKTPDANWKVAWHQDATIAVRERRDVAGFYPWSVKGGIPHVQPPV